jgi:antitoxin component YwqK of YwqJK toxin-antitoxin module
MSGLKAGLVGAAVVVGLIFGGMAIKAVMFPAESVNKSLDMAYEVTDKTLDGEKAIQEYEWFKRQEESIDALYSKEERAKQELQSYVDLLPEKQDEWSSDQTMEYQRLSSNAVGIGNMLDDAMAEYNARGKMVNRAIFKDNLPSNISRAYFAGKSLRNQ